MPNSHSDEYLTPRPLYTPNTCDSASEAESKGSTGAHRRHKGRTGGRFSGLVRGLSVAATLACVGTFTVATALPAIVASSHTAEPELIALGQTMQSAEASGVGGLDSLGTIEVDEDLTSLPQVTAELGLVDPATLDSTDLRYPFDKEWPLTDGFAYRTYPVEQFHDAQDFAASLGTPILAIGDGVVIESGFATDGCGNGIKIQHRVGAATVTSRYCHMLGASPLVQGDTVEMGDEIGMVGNTGLSFGPHLHLALRLNGNPIDPLPYINSNLAKKSDD